MSDVVGDLLVEGFPRSTVASTFVSVEVGSAGRCALHQRVRKCGEPQQIVGDGRTLAVEGAGQRLVELLWSEITPPYPDERHKHSLLIGGQCGDGCTEIPFLLQDQLEETDLLNPLALLAEAAVRHAIA